MDRSFEQSILGGDEGQGESSTPFPAIAPRAHGSLTARQGVNMVFHMKTTLNIDDGIMRRLKPEEGPNRGLANSGSHDSDSHYSVGNR